MSFFIKKDLDDLSENDRKYEKSLCPLGLNNFSGLVKIINNHKIFIKAANLRGETLMFKHNIKYFLLSFLSLILFSSCSILKLSKIDKSDVEKNKFEYTYYFYNADRAFMIGDFKEAAKLYLKCIKLNKESAASFYQLSNICIQAQNYSDALMFAKNAVRINPDNLWYQTILGLLYKQNGYINQSIEVYNQIIDKFHAETDVYYELGNLYLMNNKPNEAINIYNEFEKKYGVTEIISLEKIKIFEKQADKENIYKELNKLIEINPYDTKYYGMLAEYYSMDKQYEKALETYNKLIEIDKSNGLVHLSLADYYRKIKNFDKSFEESKLAFKSEDIELDSKINVIQTYYVYVNRNDTLKNEASELINILIEKYPKDPQVHAVYADYLVKIGKNKEAREQILLVLELDKSKYSVWEHLLLIDNEIGNYQSLYDDSKEAMEYFPNQLSLFLFKGIAATQLNKYSEAIETLKTGYNTSYDEKEFKIQFLTQLGETYHKNKDNVKSDSTFDKLLEIDPENKIVLNNYSYYLSIRGEKIEKAEKMSKKCVDLESENYTYLDTYAWVLYKAQKYKEAKDIIEKAMNNGGNKNAVIVEHYGDILYVSGEKDKAYEQWNNASKLGKASKYLEQKIKEKKLIE